MDAEKDFELINSKNDSCEECAFVKTDCPEWATQKCNGTNKVWKQKEESDDLTPNQTVIVGVVGCLVSIGMVVAILFLNAWITAWILRRFFNF